MDTTAAPGWYPDPEGGSEDRWWDGNAWAPKSAKGPAAVLGPVSSTLGWQVVVGPSLPALAPLAGRGLRGHLRSPAMLLALTTAMSVVPAMVTDTPGAGRLATLRLATGLVAALGVGALRRVPEKWRPLVAILPMVFMGVQIAAMASTLSSYRGGGSSIGAAAPHLLSTAITIVMAVRTLPMVLRGHGRGRGRALARQVPA